VAAPMIASPLASARDQFGDAIQFMPEGECFDH
jgi:hypothetical protein